MRATPHQLSAQPVSTPTRTPTPDFGPEPARALLFLGDYYGTLATARCLAARGVAVDLADSHRLNRTGASRAVAARHAKPPISDTARFIDWLVAHGKQQPGAVLYPASDELVFLFAKYREQLAPHFRLYLPSLDTIYRILNKQRLYEACVRTGVDIPETYYPRSANEFAAVLGTLGHRAYLLKPKTQIQLRSGTKAAEIDQEHAPAQAFSHFVAENPFGDELLAYDPDVQWPMVQEFLPNAATAIYSLAGFVDESHTVPVVRASRKVLQRPRKLGIGLCFEAATVSDVLLRKVGALCRDLGYHGPFELEFVEHEGKMLLIDFNPRNYSQLAFEIGRGLPIPYLQYLAATGQTAALDATWSGANAWQAGGQWAYTHQTFLSFVRGTQLVEGVTRGLGNERWGSWLAEHRGRLVDAVRDPSDPMPQLVDLLKHAQNFARHPRSFLRSFGR